MTSWDALTRECDAWSAANQWATWWWRDDDAIEPTKALEMLIALAPDAVALAVIRAGCGRSSRLHASTSRRQRAATRFCPR